MAVIKRIVLDSTPLALLFQRRGLPATEACWQWLLRHVSAGLDVFVPEIIDYRGAPRIASAAKDDGGQRP